MSVKIHAQYDKLKVVYRIGEHSCSKVWYSRAKKKLFLYVLVCIINGGDYIQGTNHHCSKYHGGGICCMVIYYGILYNICILGCDEI